MPNNCDNGSRKEIWKYKKAKPTRTTWGKGMFYEGDARPFGLPSPFFSSNQESNDITIRSYPILVIWDQVIEIGIGVAKKSFPVADVWNGDLVIVLINKAWLTRIMAKQNKRILWYLILAITKDLVEKQNGVWKYCQKSEKRMNDQDYFGALATIQKRL